MSYNPFVSDEDNKLIDLSVAVPEAKGLTALIRKFDEGWYRKWQSALAGIKEEELPDDTEEENAANTKRRQSVREALITIGVVSWNLKNKDKPVPVSDETLRMLDPALTNYIRDEIYKLNPCFWSHLGEYDLKRLKIKTKAKNV